jgi:hypothetical protein
MMGRRNQDQGQLFYSFDLDAAVPADHLVREIAAVLDLTWVHSELEPHYPVRPALGRSGTYDPYAHRRLRVRHPLGTSASVSLSRRALLCRVGVVLRVRAAAAAINKFRVVILQFPKLQTRSKLVVYERAYHVLGGDRLRKWGLGHDRASTFERSLHRLTERQRTGSVKTRCNMRS